MVNISRYKPEYTIKDLQLSLDDNEFAKGLALYNKKAVKNVKADGIGFSAVVQGTNPYRVYVHATDYERGSCNCYLGEKDILCKHMIAVAITAVYTYRPEDTELINHPLDHAVCSSEVRELSKDELKRVKSDITKALRYIKGYDGPSSIWFRYQRSLEKGSRMILMILAALPISTKTVDIVVDCMKRLDKKLLNDGVDDSDGIVGGLCYKLMDYLHLVENIDRSLHEYILQKIPQGEIVEWDKEY